MKANELRIENWYKSVKFNVPVKCDLSDLYDLCAKSDGAYNDPPIDEMFEPIPLTEEWLLKFGFEKQSDCKIGYSLILRGGHRIDFFNKELYGYLESIRLDNMKYVHQLQNLYFALTGNEIEIR